MEVEVIDFDVHWASHIVEFKFMAFYTDKGRENWWIRFWHPAIPTIEWNQIGSSLILFPSEQIVNWNFCGHLLNNRAVLNEIWKVGNIFENRTLAKSYAAKIWNGASYFDTFVLLPFTIYHILLCSVRIAFQTDKSLNYCYYVVSVITLFKVPN